MEYGVPARLVTFGDGDLLFNVAGARSRQSRSNCARHSSTPRSCPARARVLHRRWPPRRGSRELVAAVTLSPDNSCMCQCSGMSPEAEAWQLWDEHCRAPFPDRLRGMEIAGVDMVLLDADIAGCVTTWLGGASLRRRRIGTEPPAARPLDEWRRTYLGSVSPTSAAFSRSCWTASRSTTSASVASHSSRSREALLACASVQECPPTALASGTSVAETIRLKRVSEVSGACGG